jgi:hypothetical protein
MGDIVNLRMARKRARRQQDEQMANANRLAHGQQAHVRKLEANKQAKARRDLDQHRIDTGDGR